MERATFSVERWLQSSELAARCTSRDTGRFSVSLPRVARGERGVKHCHACAAMRVWGL